MIIHLHQFRTRGWSADLHLAPFCSQSLLSCKLFTWRHCHDSLLDCACRGFVQEHGSGEGTARESPHLIVVLVWIKLESHPCSCVVPTLQMHTPLLAFTHLPIIHTCIKTVRHRYIHSVQDAEGAEYVTGHITRHISEHNAELVSLCNSAEHSGYLDPLNLPACRSILPHVTVLVASNIWDEEDMCTDCCTSMQGTHVHCNFDAAAGHLWYVLPSRWC